MMKFVSLPFLIGAILLFTFNQATAQQWLYHKDFPVNLAPVDIDSNEDGTLFMLTQDNRLFYKLTNGNWTELLEGSESGGTGFSPISPLCISVNKASNLLVVGDAFSGGIFTTSNFGLNWNQMFLTTHPNTGFHETIVELTPLYNSSLFFGAALSSTLANQVIRYSNSGANGVMLNYTDQFDPDKFATELFLTSNGILLIGTENSGIITSADNGQTFEQSNQNEHLIYRFTEDQNGRVYALGYNIAQDNNFIIYSDDYQNWFAFNTPDADERYTTIYSHWADETLWLGSETGVYQTPTSSMDWDEMNLNNQNVWAIEMISDNNGEMYCFSINHIAQSLTEDEPTTWMPRIDGLSGTATQVEFGDNDRIFAAHNYFSNNVSVANSASENWMNTLLDGETFGVRDLYVMPGGKVFANTAFALQKSLDHGQTFTDITPPSLAGYIDKFYVGQAGALLMTNSEQPNTIHWSQDDGNTWELLISFPSSSPFFVEPVASMSQDSNGVIYVTMTTFEIEDGNTVHYTTDFGQTWESKTYINLEISGLGARLITKDEHTYVEMYDGIYHFDFGADENNFEEINLPAVFTNEQMPMTSFAINNVGHLYIFGYHLYASENNGATWANLGKPTGVTTASIDKIAFDSANNTYIVASETTLPEQRGIYKVVNSLSTAQNYTNSDLQIFPNPASDFIQIRSAQPINAIHVYALTGKLVKTLTGAGISNISTDDLSSGVYLFSVELLDGQTIQKKVVVR